MYVIFNQDGSIKETQLGKYVNQHSKGVDFVDVAIDGRTNEDYACDANFALPNDANVTETAQQQNRHIKRNVRRIPHRFQRSRDGIRWGLVLLD